MTTDAPQLNSAADGLNTAQLDAVTHVEGPILVLAGAGSGKTRVLTARVVRLIQHHGVHPAEILAVTFTNKAAGEMRSRVERLLGMPTRGMWIGTFHGTGARLLRSAAQLAGRTPNFTIYDEDDSIALIKRVMERVEISPKEFAPRAILAAISGAKNALVPPEEFENLARDSFSRAAARVYVRLEDSLRRANAVSFDDLLVLPVELLRGNEKLLAYYRERFKFILVDEYQDTNRAQYEFIRLLGGEHRNVMVVGDDDQSIYGWRGADIRNIRDFEKDFPGASIVRLEENYRSTPAILALANVVIEANTQRHGKTLRATRPDGEPVTELAALDERDEADWIGEEIATRRSASAGARMMLGDFAILYRTNAQSRAMEEAMRRRSIPYRLIGAVRFYDRREVRDLMSYLKLIANPSDDEAFRRAVSVPRRGLGDATIALLAERAAAAGVSMLAAAARADVVAGLRPAARTALADFAGLVGRFRTQAVDASVDELLRALVAALRYGDHLKAEGATAAERLDNVRELISGAAEAVADEGGEVGLTPLDHFLQRASLVAAVDGLGAGADAVTMMTMHNAKGLEFPVVFVTGLEDGLFPLARAYDDPAQLEEERRLFYVGITRAERKLILTHAEQRVRNGELLPGTRSSFLKAVPKGMLEQRRTTRVRSTGRSTLDSLDSGSGWGARRRANAGDWGSSAAARRPGVPVESRTTAWVPSTEDVSQDAAEIRVGARIRHSRFGGGIIAELSGAGRDLKARIDFDDERVGRKTLVVAQANLEREWE